MQRRRVRLVCISLTEYLYTAAYLLSFNCTNYANLILNAFKFYLPFRIERSHFKFKRYTRTGNVTFDFQKLTSQSAVTLHGRLRLHSLFIGMRVEPSQV